MKRFLGLTSAHPRLVRACVTVILMAGLTMESGCELYMYSDSGTPIVYDGYSGGGYRHGHGYTVRRGSPRSVSHGTPFHHR